LFSKYYIAIARKRAHKESYQRVEVNNVSTLKFEQTKNDWTSVFFVPTNLFKCSYITCILLKQRESAHNSSNALFCILSF